MNYDRMRKLAGLQPITEAHKKVNSPSKKYVATYNGKSIEVIASDESEAKRKAVDVNGLSVPMTQWGKVSVKLVESDEANSVASIEDVARYLGVTTERVGQLIVSGALTTVPPVIMISKESVVQLNDKWDDDSKHGWPQGQWGSGGSPAQPRAMRESAKSSDDAKSDKPNDSSKCENCDTKIDPKNYDRNSSGFLCVRCADERHDQKETYYQNESVSGTLAVKVPDAVIASINSRIFELNKSITEYNDKGYDDSGVKPTAIKALEQIAEDLKLEDGITKARLTYGTLMPPITDLFPPKVVNFLHAANKTRKVTENLDNIEAVHEFMSRGRDLQAQGYSIRYNNKTRLGKPLNRDLIYTVIDDSGQTVYTLSGREAGEVTREAGVSEQKDKEIAIIGYAFMVAGDMQVPFTDENIKANIGKRISDRQSVEQDWRKKNALLSGNKHAIDDVTHYFRNFLYNRRERIRNGENPYSIDNDPEFKDMARKYPEALAAARQG